MNSLPVNDQAELGLHPDQREPLDDVRFTNSFEESSEVSSKVPIEGVASLAAVTASGAAENRRRLSEMDSIDLKQKFYSVADCVEEVSEEETYRETKAARLRRAYRRGTSAYGLRRKEPI